MTALLLAANVSFSALQRAEIAEIVLMPFVVVTLFGSFSALQRAEIAEIVAIARRASATECFSALQRAEIAEIHRC